MQLPQRQAAQDALLKIHSIREWENLLETSQCFIECAALIDAELEMTSKPSIVETDFSQSAGSKASLAIVGRIVLSHERGFQKSSRALALSACSSCVCCLLVLNSVTSTQQWIHQPMAAWEVVHLHAQGGVRDCGLVFLWQVKLTLLLEARACAALMQDLEGSPMLGELLRDTVLGRDDGLRGLLGLLVLRAGGRRGGHLTPLECQMKAVELR